MASSHHSATAHCPECEPYPALRNHWFLGKLVTPRDLTDEHRYLAQKLRLHHQRLHGTGIVCGLEIRQHKNRQCQDRLVYLTPGSAIDCCGHDILVLEQDVIDLESFSAFRDLKDAPDDQRTQPHTLRLCLRYRECPTEQVPVLFDECACDDSECAPNRILETYTVELEVDPAPTVQPVSRPRFTRLTTLLIAETSAVLVDESSGRLIVLAGANLFELDASSHAITGVRALGATSHGMAIAADRSRLNLVVGGDPTTDPELVVLDIGGPVPIATAASRQGLLAGGLDRAVNLAETAGGQLVVVLDPIGDVRLWEAGIPDPATIVGQCALGFETAGLAFSSDGTKAYLAQPSTSSLQVITLDPPDLPPSTLNLGTGQSDALAMIATTGPDRLAVLDAAAGQLRLVDPNSGSVEGSVGLNHTPVDLVISQGGHWAFVVVDDGIDSYVQAVNLHLLRQGKSVQASLPEKLGPGGGRPVLANGGRRLYVPISDGVAVLDIEELDCAALLEGGDCSTCVDSDCLTLATVEGWRPGDRLIDKPNGNVLPDSGGTAWIDNTLGRVVLPSSQSIGLALKCLMAHAPSGGSGVQGPPGPAGPAGPTGAVGPKGDKGDPATQDVTLTQICRMNWEHRGNGKLSALEHGVLLAFRNDTIPDPGKVLATDLDDISVMVLAKKLEVETEDHGAGRICWCQLPGRVRGVMMHEPCSIENFNPAAPLDQGYCDGVLYEFANPGDVQPNAQLRVIVNGNFIRDRNGRGLDGDHLPEWVPDRDSGDGVEGGTFESWFTVIEG